LSSTREKFCKILIAIDGSKPSMDVADYAIRMANKNNSLLIALHVFFSQTGYAYSAGLFGGLATPSSIKKIYDDAYIERS